MTRRYTDTTLTLLVKNTDLRTARQVYVTISQNLPEDLDPSENGTYGVPFGKNEITIQANSVSYSSPNTIVIVYLTQEQNAQFKSGYVRMQINWIDNAGKRKATVIKRIKHIGNLHEEVI
jgi:hypothetical protein